MHQKIILFQLLELKQIFPFLWIQGQLFIKLSLLWYQHLHVHFIRLKAWHYQVSFNSFFQFNWTEEVKLWITLCSINVALSTSQIVIEFLDFQWHFSESDHCPSTYLKLQVIHSFKMLIIFFWQKLRFYIIRSQICEVGLGIIS